MTSQDHMCVQCVTNGLQGKTVWLNTEKDTLKKTCIHVLNVKNVFLTRSGLRQHKNIHTSKYRCTECGKCCHDDKLLAILRRSHSGEKPFECVVCSKRFTEVGNLARHSRIHTGEKPYKCHACDKAFSWSGNLTTHLRLHTGDKPYKCHMCYQAFSQSQLL